jgi:hypothetical protein
VARRRACGSTNTVDGRPCGNSVNCPIKEHHQAGGRRRRGSPLPEAPTPARRSPGAGRAADTPAEAGLDMARPSPGADEQAPLTASPSMYGEVVHEVLELSGYQFPQIAQDYWMVRGLYGIARNLPADGWLRAG